MVPVLSKISICVFAMVSSCAASLKRIPRFPPRLKPINVATGVAKARAQGQAITITEIPTINERSNELSKNNHPKKVNKAKTKIAVEKCEDILLASISIRGFLLIAVSNIDTRLDKVEEEKSLRALYRKRVSTQTVPEITFSPTFLYTGRLSPLRLDSSK